MGGNGVRGGRVNADSARDPHGGQPVERDGPPLDEAGTAIVLLHGRGASAEDILSLGRALAAGSSDVALLAPQAAGHTWYPESFMAPVHRNEPWLGSALDLLGRTLDQVVEAGVPRERTIVAGFSQGACLASEYVARNPERYGAVLAFTGGLIGPPLIDFAHEGDLDETPVYLSSGDTDPHIPWRRVEATREVLERMRGRVTMRRWPGRPHTILPDEIEQARELIAPLLS
ncbi:MAG: alpha/beta hydrolase [Gemmatimonadota bacterium]